ncbi:MAG TPA: beta-propeller fold lactonase family protein [Terracidiphilus sp.]|nr:beta-propeller fold lactonase family protein [Terracidiphilus sp.]
MRFNRSSQLVLVSAASLLAAGLVTACGTLTVDFVYVTSAQGAGPTGNGEVDVFEINSESGRMRQIPTSPFPSGGRNPVAEATSADNADLYVVNRDDNSIVQFAIGNDGKLYPQNTYNTPGVFPLAMNVTNSYLYVADTYQPLPSCSPAAPCSGSIAAYPINTDDSLKTPVTNPSLSAAYWPLTLPSNPTDVMTPTAVTTAASGAYVYVTAYDATNGGGYVFGFTVNSDGSLAPMNGGVPYAAGTKPSAIAADPSGSYVYVTDAAQNRVLTFQVNGGPLSLMSNPAQTGNVPAAIVVDGTGKYAYVANSQDGNLSAYSVSGGVLTWLGTYTTGTQPVAIGIDPSLNQYLYTANYLDATVSGFQINATDGSLLNSQFSPSKSSALPTAVAAIPHGAQAKK